MKLKCSRLKSGGQGLTLIEIAVVLALITLFIGFAYPNLYSLVPRFRLNSEVSALHNTLYYARLRAIGLNVDYRITFTLSMSPGVDLYKGEYYDYDTASWKPDEEKETRYISKDVDISFINLPLQQVGNYYVNFRPDGSVGDTDIFIFLTDKIGEKKKIQITSSTGFIKVWNNW